MTKIKEKPLSYYSLELFSGVVVILIINYFFMARFDMNSTLQVFISFVLLYIYMIIWTLFEKKFEK